MDYPGDRLPGSLTSEVFEEECPVEAADLFGERRGVVARPDPLRPRVTSYELSHRALNFIYIRLGAFSSSLNLLKLLPPWGLEP